MIFAGDFAQLPPVVGQPLYSYEVGGKRWSSTASKSQTSAIGKSLWHQVTTAVILRENMRQKEMSDEDNKCSGALLFL